MLHRVLICAVGAALAASADTVTLKTGRVVEGTYLGGDARQVRIAAGDRVETFPVTDVSEIRFGSGRDQPAGASGTTRPLEPARPARAQRPELVRPDRPAPTSPRASTRRVAEIPAGTTIAVRMIDDVDSEMSAVGDTFRASVDEPVVIDGQTVIPRGADVTAKLVADKAAGQLSGRTELTLDLVSMQVDGRTVEILTQEVTTVGESQTARTGKVVGGTAALGAIIGAIAGGGKGAAIGAVTGAGAGAAVQVMTRGARVRIPSETRLSFTLQQPVRL